MRKISSIFLFFFSLNAGAQGFLKADGKFISDSNNKEIILRGMGLGGWMLQEPYMLGLSGSAVAQYDIRHKIVDIVGEEKTKQFYNAWLTNHCTKADIDSLASWGFNSVRLPMHFNLFTLPIQKEPIKGKQTWLPKGFQLTDSLLSWCKQNKIYLILDLHAAPGGQGNDNAIADRDAALPSLWESLENRNKTIALWQALAKRYKNEPWIGGYDIINEHNWGFNKGENINCCNEKVNGPLLKLLQDITHAIRQVDKQHIIIIEGNCWGNNYEGMFPLWDKNMVLSFHKYWNYNDQPSIQKFIDYREKYNVPVWLGETGENSNAWFTDVIRLLEKNRIGWAMWPLKKSGFNNPLQVGDVAGMEDVFKYWANKGNRPSKDAAFKSLMQYAANTNIKYNSIRYDVIDAMIRQVKIADAVPYKPNIISNGAIVYASDYDLGRSGIVYHDMDSAEYWVSTNKRTRWNSGGKYRNDGVDIEVCRDVITNGYNVGWIQDGEWLQYTLYSPEKALYDINVRTTSTKDKNGSLKLIIDNKASSELFIPSDSETSQWTTNSIKAVQFNKGWNQLRLLATSGGFNLNYFQFMSPVMSPGSNAVIN
jgi:aryl-phospho-beta-D-glucosidase BglC (GH1 family)